MAAGDKLLGKSPEFDVILRAAGLGHDGAALAAAVGRADLDWLRLVDMAREHGVLALVARGLRATGWVGVPPHVVDTMTAYRTALTARNVLLGVELLEILSLLAGEGIAALPYKGPVEAAYVYGDIGLRPFVDLDVLVSPPEALRALALLHARGYRPLTPDSERRQVSGLPRGDYAFALRREDERAVVELHWRLSPSFPLTLESLLPDTRPFPLLGATVPCLTAERFLLVLCVHGSRHAWDRLEWICAVAHLLQRQSTLDWQGVTAQAKALGARRALALGLTLAASVAGATVPDGVLEAAGDSRVRPVERQIAAGLDVRAPRRPYIDAARRHLLVFRAGSFVDGLRYLLLLCRPSGRDRAFLPLPDQLAFLYPAVRPVRILWEHARHGIDLSFGDRPGSGGGRVWTASVSGVSGAVGAAPRNPSHWLRRRARRERPSRSNPAS
jgi:hypothetical protein